MRRLGQGRLLTAAVVATTAALIVFTVLQYRSSREAAEATGLRLADTLQMSLVNWHVDFERSLTGLTGTLDVQLAGVATPERVSAALRVWRRTARYPALVRQVLLYVPATGAGEAVPVSADGAPSGPVPLPPIALAPVTDASADPWLFHPAIPALTRQVGVGPDPRWLIVVIDRDVLGRALLPDLALRYFSGTDGLDYDVALFAGPGRALYASSPEFGASPAPDADGLLNVFGRRSSPRAAGPYEVFLAVPLKAGAPSPTVTWYPLPAGAPEADDWRLVVRHRRGGALGAFLANAQRRDLLTTLGALLLLVTSIALLVAASTRAQRLAQLQMSFVTAVSHELRTPLAVIGSAADNIARGVVHEASRLAEYGQVIGQQTRQLGSLVERILLFAGRTGGAPRPALRPLAVPDTIDATLSTIAELTGGAAFTVDRDIQPDLPPVLGDPTALAQCLENLLTNAVKYAGTERWIGVRAYTERTAAGAVEVCVDVSDRGLGIPAAERGRIFEPFYRGPAAIAAQIHGTGLGLALARSMAEMMDGTITVRSQPGQGSTFTLRLPAAPADRAHA
ncbi:MAG: sensor histidine kinase [Vicinamibacterales bacterium]